MCSDDRRSDRDFDVMAWNGRILKPEVKSNLSLKKIRKVVKKMKRKAKNV